MSGRDAIRVVLRLLVWLVFFAVVGVLYKHLSEDTRFTVGLVASIAGLGVITAFVMVPVVEDRELDARERRLRRQDIERREEKTMADLQPSVGVGIKLASIAVHADELLSPEGHQVDVEAIRGLMTDPEVVAYLDLLRPLALLPVKR